MKLRMLSLLSAVLASSLLLSFQRAEALTLTYSDKTQRVAPYFDFRGDYDLPFNLNLSGSLGLTPDLASFVPPVSGVAGGNVGADLISQALANLKYDVLADLQLNGGYNFRLLDLNLGIGQLSTSLIPYVGYRQMWTWSGGLTTTSGSSQLNGINYGAKVKVGLPLGFSGYAYAGASTLLGGSQERGGDRQTLNTGGMMLPEFGAGAAWNLPLVNLASVYLGYRGWYLPADLRLNTDFKQGSLLVHGVSLGFNVLFFGV